MIDARLQQLIDARVKAWCDALPPGALYQPMRYLLDLPAKRVRPALVLMGCELFGGRAEDALDEALGIELFHNFTLMHDDIMDAAPLRRGRPTVHERFGVKAAILSGDAMLVKAYQLMAKRPAVLKLFSRTAIEVCEGQQRDMDMEREHEVEVEAYDDMIRLKTAVLLSCALRTGALIAGAGTTDVDRVGSFGEHLGMAFQLRDDLLDAFGDESSTGKQRGGDLRAGKKTRLLIRALERCEEEGITALHEQLRLKPEQRDVDRMLFVLQEVGAKTEAEAEVLRHDAAAMEAIGAVNSSADRKRPLLRLAEVLLERSY
jgi:geranylgeranyl diphosphate synthase type II